MALRARDQSIDASNMALPRTVTLSEGLVNKWRDIATEVIVDTDEQRDSVVVSRNKTWVFSPHYKSIISKRKTKKKTL